MCSFTDTQITTHYENHCTGFIQKLYIYKHFLSACKSTSIAIPFHTNMYIVFTLNTLLKKRPCKSNSYKHGLEKIKKIKKDFFKLHFNPIHFAVLLSNHQLVGDGEMEEDLE